MRFVLVVLVALVGLWLMEREIRPRRREQEIDERILAELRSNKDTAAARRS